MTTENDDAPDMTDIDSADMGKVNTEAKTRGEVRTTENWCLSLQERGGEKGSRDGRPCGGSSENENSNCKKCGNLDCRFSWLTLLNVTLYRKETNPLKFFVKI